MNIPSRKALAWAAVVMCGSLGGCANRPDLISVGRVTLEPRIDRALRRPPEVYEERGDLVVAGRLAPGMPLDSGGHVDVSVIAPDGTTVFDARLNYQSDTVSSADVPKPLYRSFDRVRTRRYGNYLAFMVRFPGLPPDGSVVKVRHDPEPHDAR